MNNLTLPYKTTIAGGGAPYYEIDMSWTISNVNAMPIWVSCQAMLAMRLGGWGFDIAAKKEAEIWVKYDPAQGFQVDYSQMKFPHGERPQEFWNEWQDDLKSVLGTVYGAGIQMPWDDSTAYRFPSHLEEADVSPRVSCSIRGEGHITIAGRRSLVETATGAMVKVPASTKLDYHAILTIPGPGASSGMARFWSNYDDPDFHVTFAPVEIAYYRAEGPNHGKPKLNTGGKPLDIRVMRNELEIKLRRPSGITDPFGPPPTPTAGGYHPDDMHLPQWERRIWDIISGTYI